MLSITVPALEDEFVGLVAGHVFGRFPAVDPPADWVERGEADGAPKHRVVKLRGHLYRITFGINKCAIEKLRVVLGGSRTIRNAPRAKHRILKRIGDPIVDGSLCDSATVANSLTPLNRARTNRVSVVWERWKLKIHAPLTPTLGRRVPKDDLRSGRGKANERDLPLKGLASSELPLLGRAQEIGDFQEAALPRPVFSPHRSGPCVAHCLRAVGDK